LQVIALGAEMLCCKTINPPGWDLLLSFAVVVSRPRRDCSQAIFSVIQNCRGMTARYVSSSQIVIRKKKKEKPVPVSWL
jgi:hypothetical protein